MPPGSPRIGPGSVPFAVISKSADIARAAHEGQVDKAGVPYIEHPLAVAQQAAAISKGDPAVIAAAWLHDVVEDTDWTIEALLGAGIPAEVVQLVDAVTRLPDEGYLADFIPRIIAAGRKAVLLKLADIWHNTHPDRAGSLPEHLRMRYETAHRMLTDALVEMPEPEPKVVRPEVQPEETVDVPGVSVDLRLDPGDPLVLIKPVGNGDGTATIEVFGSGIAKDELTALFRTLATTIEESVVQ